MNTKEYTENIKCLTVANSVSFSWSSEFVAQEAKNWSKFGDGGVVMSKNLVSIVRREQVGSLSCGIQFLTIPVISVLFIY